MKIYTAKRAFSASTHGNLVKGDIIDDLPEAIAIQWLEHDLIELVGNSAKAAAAPSSSSQAVQASVSGNADTQTTPLPKSSQSTPVSARSTEALYTAATGSGGTSTTKKPTAKRGRPAKKPQGDTD